MTVSAQIIHLERAEARRVQVARLLADLPCDSRVFAAIDGAALDEATLFARYRRASFLSPRYPFALTRGETACFLSHRATWVEIAEGDTAAGLVLEDDAAVDVPAFTEALAFAMQHIAEEGIIQFQPRPIAGDGVMVAQQGALTIMRPTIIPARLTATLYSKAAAARLLEVTEVFDRPVDGVMQMPWVTDLPVAIIQPSGLREVSEALGGTTIQAKGHRPLARIKRELERTLYRIRIARASRKDAAARAAKRGH